MASRKGFAPLLASTLLAAPLVLLAACGTSDGSSSDQRRGGDAPADAGEAGDTGDADYGARDASDASDAPVDVGPADVLEAAADAPADVFVPDADAGCVRAPAAPDRARKVIISHPYDPAGNASDAFEVLDLSAAGALSRPGVTFSMARASFGEMAFTPDGAIGIVPGEQGTLGVVRSEADGAPVVVHASFQGSFYAGRVIVEPAGDSALVLDPNWRNNGGGIYRVRIACDGTLTDEGLVAPAKLPRGLALLPGNRAVLAASDVLASTAVNDAHLLSLAPSPQLLASASTFGDDLAIVGGMTVTHDGKHALIGDYSEFSGLPNRIGVAAVGASTLEAIDVLSPIEDPVAIVASPFDDAALVVSGYGNAFFVLSYDPSAPAHPFALVGEPSYQGKRPQLPAGAVAIGAGSLVGRVLVAENVGVRQVQFGGGGAVTDLGAFAFGGGLDEIVGVIGVQP